MRGTIKLEQYCEIVRVKPFTSRQQRRDIAKEWTVEIKRLRMEPVSTLIVTIESNYKLSEYGKSKKRLRLRQQPTCIS